MEAAEGARSAGAEGRAAHQAIKKHFFPLMNAVVTGDIIVHLYSEGMVDDSTFDVVTSRSVVMSSQQRGTEVLKSVQAKVQAKADKFKKFCEILKSDGDHTDLADKLSETMKDLTIDEQEVERDAVVTKKPDDFNTHEHDKFKKDYLEKGATLKKAGASVEFQDLKRELEVYKKASARPDPPDNTQDLIEKAIHYHIETAHESGISVEIVKEEMQSLSDPECLISAETCKWALKEIDSIWKNGKSSKSMAVVPRASLSQVIEHPSLPPPLLYHALLCSKAVTTCSSTKGVHEFFSQVGHKLEEASFSPQGSNVNQYIMAKNGNTFYLAFQSEVSITRWLDIHNTFEEGLDLQTKQVPLSFFIEQILKEKTIVLTGFSFGGLLACYIAAYIWRASCLDVARLQKNLMCITFGQPLFNIPYVQEMIQIYPAFEQTLHLVLDKEDIVPPILCYFGIGCVLKSHALTKSAPKQNLMKSATSPSDSDRLKTDFRGTFSSLLLSSLASLQDALQKKPLYSSAVQKSSPASSIPTQSLAKLKEILDELVKQNAERLIEPSLLIGNVHLMKYEATKGLVWKGLVSKRDVKDELLNLQRLIEKIDVNLFKKHNMEDYQLKTLRCHLEREYHLPELQERPTKMRLQEVSILQPRADLVEFHMYPDEHVIVLEGNNLWFCHKVHLGEDEKVVESSLATNIMRRKIEFRFTPSPNFDSIADNGGVAVKLYSHFAEPVCTQVLAKEECYPFSLRQIQLAKHTPTEIIQLAYSTAMLECPLKMCGDCDQPTTSKRFEAVKTFLEEAAKIVPLESVLYAIAYSDKDTAIQCGKALQASGLHLPLSEMMRTGSMAAADRVYSGLTSEEYSEKAAQQSLESFLDLPFHDPEPTLPTELSPFHAITAPVPFMQRPYLESPPQARYVQLPPAPGQVRRSYSDVTRKSRQSPPQVKEVISVSIIPIPVPVPTPVMSTTPLDEDLADYMDQLQKDLERKCYGKKLQVISKKSIEHFCPFGPRRQTLKECQLQSPLQVLKEARQKLMSFVETSELDASDQENTLAINTEMLRIVRNIQDKDMKTCAALLAAFMEQTIRIPMLKSNIDTARFLSSEQASVTMGTWAFISMGFDNIEQILSSSQGSSLIVEVEDYIMGVHELSKKFCKSEEQTRPSSDRRYAAKLNFLVNGIKKNTGGRSVTCSTQYISYSLEHHLFKRSQQLHFDKSLSVKQLVERWDSTFKEDALILVAKSHRHLIACWLKWALLVHDLREVLASYTCIGVIGLSNSGKSLLVKSLFDIQTQVGTTEKKRTVVPFIYSMDGRVDKLDVIDFPGVDDTESVPQLAKLLVSLAQVVLFVVNYRNICNETVIQWLKQLEKEDQIHVHVCLTHGDWLYKELERKEAANKPKMTLLIKQELTVISEKVGRHPSRSMRFYCFDISDNQQALTLDTLREVGVYSPKDVGEWLVQTVDDKLAQSELAENLKQFFNKSAAI